MITGKDLIELGFKPGKWFKDAITYVNENNLEGEAMTEYLNSVRPPDVIPLLDNHVFFHENISAETEIEKQNVDAVKLSMQVLMKTPTVVAGAIMPDACPFDVSSNEALRLAFVFVLIGGLFLVGIYLIVYSVFVHSEEESDMATLKSVLIGIVGLIFVFVSSWILPYYIN